jgi:predicted hydrocarbon binding protein
MKTPEESGSKISKKEIQKKIRGILMKAIGLLGIRIPSRKLKKEIKGTSKNVGELVAKNLENSANENKLRSKASKEKNKKKKA